MDIICNDIYVSMLITDFPKNKHTKYLQAAYKAAFLCPGFGCNRFRLGAVLVYKKQILAIKTNTGKTHPKLQYNNCKII